MSSSLSRKKEQTKKSRSQSNKSASISTTCMARALDMRPVRLYAGSWDSEAIEVQPRIGAYTAPLWFPRSMIYEYKSDLFTSLEAAYARGDRPALCDLWNKAVSWRDTV